MLLFVNGSMMHTYSRNFQLPYAHELAFMPVVYGSLSGFSYHESKDIVQGDYVDTGADFFKIL